MRARKPIFIHYVHDMQRAIDFYCAVFTVTPREQSPGWTQLDFGVFDLALHILSPGHIDELPLPHAGLNLEVDSIEDIQVLVEDHGGEFFDLREANAYIPNRVAGCRDPEGNGFEVRQHVGLQP